MLRRDIIPGKYFPPGYDYEKEQNTAFFLFGFGVVLSFEYYWRLYQAVEDLYLHRDGKLILRENALAEPFEHLLSRQWMFFMPFFLFLLAMAINHYLYYHSAGGCLNLMRRLPGRDVLLKSCAQVSVFLMIAGTLLIEFLYLLYYIVYLLMMPSQCLP